MKKLLHKSLLITLLVGAGLYAYMALPNVSALRKRNPGSTALMNLRDQEYRQSGVRRGRQQIWVPYSAISDHLKKAILLAEDASFFSHPGIDFEELKAAMKTDWETMSLKRGGSTITMQLARNLYLSPSKNPLRKIKEIIIAWQLERTLSKRRIFEIYLNIVEWGRNIYGAEAAARHYFGKSAANLNVLEAATLAALLPNPRQPRRKSLLYRRNLILRRFVALGTISAEDYNRAKETPLFQEEGAAIRTLTREN